MAEAQVDVAGQGHAKKSSAQPQDLCFRDALFPQHSTHQHDPKRLRVKKYGRGADGGAQDAFEKCRSAQNQADACYGTHADALACDPAVRQDPGSQAPPTHKHCTDDASPKHNSDCIQAGCDYGCAHSTNERKADEEFEDYVIAVRGHDAYRLSKSCLVLQSHCYDRENSFFEFTIWIEYPCPPNIFRLICSDPFWPLSIQTP